MADQVTPNTPTRLPSAQHRGEVIAYALQNGLFGFGANLFEPYVNSSVQKMLAHRQKGRAQQKAYGGYFQNLLGEVAGDVAGVSVLVAGETWCPVALHTVLRNMRQTIDPLYNTVAQWVFSDEVGSPDYQKKVDEWKLAQERNFCRSAIMSVAGMTANIAAQKLVLNEAPISAIFKGKLCSSVLTTSLGLAARVALADQTKGIDVWLSKNLFAPMLRKQDAGTRELVDSQSESHVEKLQNIPLNTITR